MDSFKELAERFCAFPSSLRQQHCKAILNVLKRFSPERDPGVYLYFCACSELNSDKCSSGRYRFQQLEPFQSFMYVYFMLFHIFFVFSFFIFQCIFSILLYFLRSRMFSFRIFSGRFPEDDVNKCDGLPASSRNLTRLKQAPKGNIILFPCFIFYRLTSTRGQVRISQPTIDKCFNESDMFKHSFWYIFAYVIWFDFLGGSMFKRCSRGRQRRAARCSWIVRGFVSSQLYAR